MFRQRRSNPLPCAPGVVSHTQYTRTAHSISIRHVTISAGLAIIKPPLATLDRFFPLHFDHHKIDIDSTLYTL
jgi:hypothetical protein